MLETMKFEISGKKLVTLLLRIMDIAACELFIEIRQIVLGTQVGNKWRTIWFVFEFIPVDSREPVMFSNLLATFCSKSIRRIFL